MLVIPISYKITLNLKNPNHYVSISMKQQHYFTFILYYLTKYSSSDGFTGPCFNNFHQVIFNIRDGALELVNVNIYFIIYHVLM